MTSQRFCLRWNNHQSNMLSVFDQLLHAETFTDVTLAVEGQYLKAHKMVLSACSPYFNALFVNHPEKHPIVILKDVPYSDMKSLLDFMYRGEVSVDQERLTAFLRVAESLRIKGLTEVNDDKPMGPTMTPPPPPPPQLHRIQPYLAQQRKNQTNMLMNSPLLGSALSSMPKRKRGRPRKLSGSSNGTGNDCDDYDRDNLVQGSPEMLEVKMGTEGYSANEGSDDNHRDSGDNDQEQDSHLETMDTSESLVKPQLLKEPSVKDNDNSTSDHVNNSPELTQRLLGIKKEPAVNKIQSVPRIRINPSVQASTASNTTSSNTSSNYSNSFLQQQLQNDSLNNNNTSNNNNKAASSNPTTGLTSANTTDLSSSSASNSNRHQHFLMQITNATTASLSTPDYFKDECALQNSSGKNNNDANTSETDIGGNKNDTLSPTPSNTHMNPHTSRQPQRRRVRRKANSSLDDQAEHLTEMSVRGLDLFRYASITEGVYQCTECAKENVQKTFKNKYSFQRHAFLYHEGKHRKVFPCPVCAKEFSRPDKMKNHMKTTHECYIPKDVNYHHPLNYLITAAAAGEIQQIFPQLDRAAGSNESPNNSVPTIKNEKNLVITTDNIIKNENLHNPPTTVESSIQMNETEEVK